MGTPGTFIEKIFLLFCLTGNCYCCNSEQLLFKLDLMDEFKFDTIFLFLLLKQLVACFIVVTHSLDEDFCENS